MAASILEIIAGLAILAASPTTDLGDPPAMPRNLQPGDVIVLPVRIELTVQGSGFSEDLFKSVNDRQLKEKLLDGWRKSSRIFIRLSYGNTNDKGMALAMARIAKAERELGLPAGTVQLEVIPPHRYTWGLE